MGRFDDISFKSERPQTFSITGLTEEEVSFIHAYLKREVAARINYDLANSILHKMGEV